MTLQSRRHSFEHRLGADLPGYRRRRDATADGRSFFQETFSKVSIHCQFFSPLNAQRETSDRLCSKHGRRSKFKWPDTFLIESSGRRETPESIAESKAREARKQNQTVARQQSNGTPEEEEENVTDAESEHEPEHRFFENDTGSDQDISEDEDFEDSIIDETSKTPRIIVNLRLLLPPFYSWYTISWHVTHRDDAALTFSLAIKSRLAVSAVISHYRPILQRINCFKYEFTVVDRG